MGIFDTQLLRSGAQYSALQEQLRTRQAAFAKELRSALAPLGLELAEVAAAIRIAQADLAMWTSGRGLPTRLGMDRLMSYLFKQGVPRRDTEDLEFAFLRVRDVRSQLDLFKMPEQPGASSSDVVIEGDGEVVNVTIRNSNSPLPVSDAGPPQLVEDLDGYQCRPNPLDATTTEEFVEVMRRFWRWTGGYSSRQLSEWSNGAFSHTTIANLLAEKPRKRPKVTQKYVRGFVHACGGDETEISRWITAYRRIYEGFTPAQSPPAAKDVVSLSPWRSVG